MQVVKHGLIYLSASIVNKAVPFLLLPIMTRYLSPAEYGLLSLFVVLNGLVGAFVGMAMHTNIATNFYTESREQVGKVIGNVVIVLAATTCIALLLIAPVSVAFDELFSLPTRYFLLMPLLAFMSMVATLNTTILRNEGRVYAFAIFEIGQTVLTVATTMVLLAGFGWGWMSQVSGMLVSGIVFLVVSWRYMLGRGFLRLQFDQTTVRDILALSLPLVPHALGGIVIAASDRIFIERMVGLEAVALYSVGYSFGMAMSLVSDSFARAWGPWVYRTLAMPTDEAKREIVRHSYFAIAGMYVAAILIAWVAAGILPFMVTDSYRAASEFILWVTLAYATRGVYQVFFPFLVHLRKTSFLAVSTVIAACLNIVLNVVFIDAFGAIGAAYATMASFAASALLVFAYQSRKYPMPWFRIAG